LPTDFAFEDGAIYIHTPDAGLKPGWQGELSLFEIDRYNDTVTDRVLSWPDTDLRSGRRRL
jgi:hypothetical protein